LYLLLNRHGDIVYNLSVMFVRLKKFSGKRTTRQYLQVVESYRQEGKMRQRVICTLGRLERERFNLNYPKIEKEARYDGKYVLRTNTELSVEEVALAFKNLWLVESAFRHIRDILKIRPIFFWTPVRVRGYVFVCFLAFILIVTLQKKLLQLGIQESLWNTTRDVREVKGILLWVKNEYHLVHTELKGMTHLAFKAVSLSPPARVKPLS
jgi:transposase